MTRALQQVFDYVQDYNKKSGRQVRCYVPTHSLLNYTQWQIVSPEGALRSIARTRRDPEDRLVATDGS